MAHDGPQAIAEHSSLKRQTSDSDTDPSCPFCTIAKTFQSISPADVNSSKWDPELLTPPTYTFLSTPHIIAFLDIAPLTRGHVLVVPRQHRVKIGNLTPDEAGEIGRVLPVIARAVMAATYPDIAHDEMDYNVVQNNGPGAAQVIPHVHFHIIPRPPLDYKPPTSSSAPASIGRYAQAKVPTGIRASSVLFGRGQREELDDDEANDLVKIIRECLRKEWLVAFGNHEDITKPRERKL